jgi:hypothetical protein
MCRRFAVAVLLLLAAVSRAFAQLPPDYLGRTGGVTQEVCVTPAVTAGAYSAGNVVGGLITLPAAFLIANSGVLQSIRLTVKSVQAAEFDVTFFSAQPSAASTFNDHAAPAIAAADVPLAQPPVKLITSFSGLVATVYGADNIGRGFKEIGPSLYAIITTPGTPTFTSTTDLQLCVGLSQD